jgi:hypothetical protein
MYEAAFLIMISNQANFHSLTSSVNAALKLLPDLDDGYCDCGVDEPSTSACSGTSPAADANFACANAGFLPALIPASRVGDGLCDCCDCSDESASSANAGVGAARVNSCASEAAEYLKKYGLMLNFAFHPSCLCFHCKCARFLCFNLRLDARIALYADALSSRRHMIDTASQSGSKLEKRLAKATTALTNAQQVRQHCALF